MRDTKTNRRIYIVITGVIILIMSAVLYAMGRVPICDCGYVKLWHGVVVSSENSQHIFDWYTFTHISHGLFMYFLVSLAAKGMPVWKKLIIAVSLESAWEVLENTDMVINRYRAATISLDYFGDSIINSVGDVLAMIVGFWFAYRKPAWMSALLFVALEAFLAVMIRDNLTINIIMLISPIEAIKVWQNS
jgi:hypothetical protein